LTSLMRWCIIHRMSEKLSNCTCGHGVPLLFHNKLKTKDKKYETFMYQCICKKRTGLKPNKEEAITQWNTRMKRDRGQLRVKRSVTEDRKKILKAHLNDILPSKHSYPI
jgi:hypothetical protein